MTRIFCSALTIVCVACIAAGADDPPAASPSPPPAAGPVPLNPQQTVLLDLSNRRLLLKTKVVLKEGRVVVDKR